MQDKSLTEHLSFLVSQRQQDEATILAQALRAGIEALYRETLVEAYLLGKIPRETALRELGSEQLEEIDYQNEVLRRDVEWGRKGA